MCESYFSLLPPFHRAFLSPSFLFPLLRWLRWSTKEAPLQHQGLDPSAVGGSGKLKQLFSSTETTDDGQSATTWYSLTIGNTLWCVSKLFASFGDHAEYFLNESLL